MRNAILGYHLKHSFYQHDANKVSLSTDVKVFELFSKLSFFSSSSSSSFWELFTPLNRGQQSPHINDHPVSGKRMRIFLCAHASSPSYPGFSFLLSTGRETSDPWKLRFNVWKYWTSRWIARAQLSNEWLFSSPEAAILNLSQHQVSKPLATPNTGSPLFTDALSLTNLIGWKLEKEYSAHAQKLGMSSSDGWEVHEVLITGRAWGWGLISNQGSSNRGLWLLLQNVYQLGPS